MHYAEFAEDEVGSTMTLICSMLLTLSAKSVQSVALREAIKEYEANKWKVIGQKVGKPAKVSSTSIILPSSLISNRCWIYIAGVWTIRERAFQESLKNGPEIWRNDDIGALSYFSYPLPFCPHCLSFLWFLASNTPGLMAAVPLCLGNKSDTMWQEMSWTSIFSLQCHEKCLDLLISILFSTKFLFSLIFYRLLPWLTVILYTLEHTKTWRLGSAIMSFPVFLPRRPWFFFQLPLSSSFCSNWSLAYCAGIALPGRHQHSDFW